MSDAPVIGVWYRAAPGYRSLHVARWVATDSGARVESACGGPVVSPRVDATTVPLLAIPKTAEEALAMIQPQQSAALCRKCRALFARQ
jgi:hypothetical protein